MTSSELEREFWSQNTQDSNQLILRAADALALVRRRRVAVSLDGEVRSMTPPLHYRILAGALPVIRAPA